MVVLKEGQVEHPRPFEALNDQVNIKYDIDENGNILSQTEQRKVEID